MRTAYFECSAGASGDMLLGSLLDALIKFRSGGDDLADVENGLADWKSSIAGFFSAEPGSRLEVNYLIRGDVRALKVDFFVGETHADHHHGHKHRHLRQVVEILEQQHNSGRFDRKSLDLSLRVFSLLAEAEGLVHGVPPEKVHFHEVGAFDSIMDIAGFSSAVSLLGIDSFSASEVTIGSGTVETAHGNLAVPPPAVVELLRKCEIPTSSIVLPGECLTPTGAAVLGAAVRSWGPMPAFRRALLQGVGAGTREVAGKANVVRVIIGETD